MEDLPHDLEIREECRKQILETKRQIGNDIALLTLQVDSSLNTIKREIEAIDKYLNSINKLVNP